MLLLVAPRLKIHNMIDLDNVVYKTCCYDINILLIIDKPNTEIILFKSSEKPNFYVPTISCKYGESVVTKALKAIWNQTLNSFVISEEQLLASPWFVIENSLFFAIHITDNDADRMEIVMKTNIEHHLLRGKCADVSMYKISLFAVDEYTNHKKILLAVEKCIELLYL